MKLLVTLVRVTTQIRKWRHAVGQAGIDLMDGGPNLLDLRFADNIIICTRSRHELDN